MCWYCALCIWCVLYHDKLLHWALFGVQCSCLRKLYFTCTVYCAHVLKCVNSKPCSRFSLFWQHLPYLHVLRSFIFTRAVLVLVYGRRRCLCQRSTDAGDRAARVLVSARRRGWCLRGVGAGVCMVPALVSARRGSWCLRGAGAGVCMMPALVSMRRRG